MIENVNRELVSTGPWGDRLWGGTFVDRVLEMACLSQLTYLAHKQGTEFVQKILESGSPGLVPKYQAIEFLKAPRLFGSPQELVCCGIVASNETETVIAIRGTENLEDYFYGLMVEPNSENMHYGFSIYVESFWQQLAEFLSREDHGKKDIFITGHSLGGAAATVLTRRLQQPQFKPKPPHKIETYIFGAPPVSVGELVLETPLYRFRQKEDFIPHLRELTFSLVEGIPGLKIAIASFNPSFLANLEKYTHIGDEYVIAKDYQISEGQALENVNFWQLVDLSGRLTTQFKPTLENVNFWQLADLSRLLTTQFKPTTTEEINLRKLLKALIQNFFDDHRAIRYVERLNNGQLPPWWSSKD